MPSLRPVVWLLVLIIGAVPGTVTAQSFQYFITRDGDRLMDGDQEFRFISFNVPNLFYVEDAMAFDNRMPFRFPDEFEMRDALATIRQMGGLVARTYTLAVFQESAPPGTPKFVEGPGEFNEEAFKTLDRAIALANEEGVRLIIPLVNNFQWWGGVADYAAFRDKPGNAFWTDPQLIEDFEETVRFVLARVNSITGVPYREDKAILAWETANESQCPHSWTRQIAAFMKSLDPNHLVVDGFLTPVLRQDSISDENVDIVQTHHYEGDPRLMVEHIRTSAAMAKHRKPYIVGEFGFVGTEATRTVLSTAIGEGLAGALIWSLRYHRRAGGFFWHSEPSGGDFFKSYHWPGFPSGETYDESGLMTLMRQKAFEIRGLAVPQQDRPMPPRLLPIQTVSAISWQGSTGAAGYDVERSESAGGPWHTVAFQLSDARFQYRPLFSDDSAKIGKSYFYRIRARNAAGTSDPGNVVGPVPVTVAVLVDELVNEGQIYFKDGNLSLRQNQARRYKEDASRLDGRMGAWILYRVPGPIASFKVFAFGEGGEAGLRFSLSSDGKQFEPIETAVTNYSAGEGEYGYLSPILYAGNVSGSSSVFLRIEFASAVALSRVEIRHRP